MTTWTESGNTLELTDCMLWPSNDRPSGHETRRVMVRRLRCVEGCRRIMHRAVVREDFKYPVTVTMDGDTALLRTPSLDLGLWSSHPMHEAKEGEGVHLEMELKEGEEIWAVLDSAADAGQWTVAKAKPAVEATLSYWRNWSGKLDCSGARAEQIRLSAIVVHLFTYAPTGAIIAAPTTCLPERVPGEYNYNYRYCWIRDGSLSVSLLTQLGATDDAKRFLTWSPLGCALSRMTRRRCRYKSSIGSPEGRKSPPCRGTTSRDIGVASRSRSVIRSTKCTRSMDLASYLIAP